MGAAETRAAAALLLLVFSWVGPCAGAAESSGAFAVKEIAAGDFVHVGRQVALDAPGHDDIANLGFVIGTQCVAVIDTGGSVLTGGRLRRAISAHTKLPICYVINTHVHVDHVLGNAAFRGDGPSFVGHARLADAISASRDFFLTHYAQDLAPAPAANQIIGPDRLVEHETILDLGGRELRLRAWPKAHTDCDLTVLDAAGGVLWSGDLLFRRRLPALDGSVTGWLAALDDLSRSKVRWVVPGHGEPGGDIQRIIEPQRRYLEALRDGVRRELHAGASMQDAIDTVAIEERPHWMLWDGVHAHNVARAYQELEWE